MSTIRHHSLNQISENCYSIDGSYDDSDGFVWTPESLAEAIEEIRRMHPDRKLQIVPFGYVWGRTSEYYQGNKLTTVLIYLE